MQQSKKHPVKKWEVSLMELQNHIGKMFKVTRKIPGMSIAETKIFRTMKTAKKQFDEWLK